MYCFRLSVNSVQDLKEKTKLWYTAKLKLLFDKWCEDTEEAGTKGNSNAQRNRHHSPVAACWCCSWWQMKVDNEALSRPMVGGLVQTKANSRQWSLPVRPGTLLPGLVSR